MNFTDNRHVSLLLLLWLVNGLIDVFLVLWWTIDVLWWTIDARRSEGIGMVGRVGLESQFVSMAV